MNPSQEDIRRAAKVFKALSHPGRLEVACHLAQGGPSTQKALMAEMHCPQSSMARHLVPLRELGLVRGRRRGPEIVLEVSSELISHLVQALCDWFHEKPGPQAQEEA